MIAFQPQGPIVGFTGATTAPTSVQAVSLSNVGVQAYNIDNTSTSIDCVVGWGASDAEAKANAAAGASTVNCHYLNFRTSEVIIASKDAYFSGITASSTAIIKIQAGIVF
jgi:hypothetical protein